MQDYYLDLYEEKTGGGVNTMEHGAHSAIQVIKTYRNVDRGGGGTDR